MKRLCRDCGREFNEKPPNSRGFVNQCLSCSRGQEEPQPLGGNMIWHHKTAPYIEIKPLSEAKIFARKTKRFGATVTACLVEPKEKKGFNKEE